MRRIILAALLLTPGCKPDTSPSSTRADPEAGELAKLKADAVIARAYMIRDLKDPESARFRNVSIAHVDPKLNVLLPDARNPAIRTIVCGELNARNAMGGYNGYTPFGAVLGTKSDQSNAEKVVITEPQDDLDRAILGLEKTKMEIWCRAHGAKWCPITL